MEMAETAVTAEAVTDLLMVSLPQDLTDHLKTMLLNKEEIVTDLLMHQVKADHQAVATVVEAAVAADHQVVAAADAVVETKLICI